MTKKSYGAAIAAALVIGLGFSVPASAGSFGEMLGAKLQATKPDCKNADSNFLCLAKIKPTTHGAIAGPGNDFEWFKKINDLPNSTTRDTPAPAFMLYIVGYKK